MLVRLRGLSVGEATVPPECGDAWLMASEREAARRGQPWPSKQRMRFALIARKAAKADPVQENGRYTAGAVQWRGHPKEEVRDR
jgi:hypothetical protein